jgi:FixJ family two-component response regulator
MGNPVVIVIDDDPSMLRALRRLIAGAGFEVKTFDRPSALLSADLSNGACLVADIYLTEMTGVMLSEKLAHSGRFLPTILVSARLDEKTKLLASRIHPVALLPKPFRREQLLLAIGAALQIESH